MIGGGSACKVRVEPGGAANPTFPSIMSLLSVRLDKHTYFPGDQVSGEVILDLSRVADEHLESVHVRLLARELTCVYSYILPSVLHG
jgi:hypothetical protein